MSTYDWSARQRNYKKEVHHPDAQEVETHPLQSTTVVQTESSNIRVKSVVVAGDGDDPLSMIAAQVDTDPLSAAVVAATHSTGGLGGAGISREAAGLDDSFEPWEAKRQGILSRYTTNEKLSISFSANKGAQVKENITNLDDKVKNRLEQLDDIEEGSVQEQLDISQAEYVKTIDNLNEDLKRAWEAEQRVKSLKIVIQCSKLLADTSVLPFYPSKFVLITDILDTFGKLVFGRIFFKSSFTPPGSGVSRPLPNDFTPDMVPASAKETCRNWFFKIASIRELIPRLFVEASILKCYSFLTTSEYDQALARLTNMMRGIGDPLVAVYARCYLCRVGVVVAPLVRNHLRPNFNDFMTTYKEQLNGKGVKKQMESQNVKLPAYLHLYVPALDWILQCIAYRADEKTLVEILEISNTIENNALLLNSIMSSFPPEYIASRAMSFCTAINAASETGYPKYQLFRSLGLNVTLSAPPENVRLDILREVWKFVTKLQTVEHYIACAEVWIDFPVKYFGKREINQMLGDIIKHVLPERAFENFLPQLQSVLAKVLSGVKDFNVLFSMDKFLPFVDLFQKDHIKVEVCKNIMEAFVRNQAEPTSDPVIISALLYVGRTLHDSVTALTFIDEKKQITRMLTKFLTKMTFGNDFEANLNFFVDARGNFSNLDEVLSTLVHSTNFLIMRTREVVKGNHTRKTAAFVRSCIAYNYITIPSINDPVEKLRLYLESGHTAVVNQALSQADAMLRAAVMLLADLPLTIDIDGVTESTEPMVMPLINSFLSTLLIVPDDENEVLGILKSLLNTIAKYKWPVTSDAMSCIFIDSILLLNAFCQPKYCYGVKGVEANDTLYGPNPKFYAEVYNIIDSMIAQILGYLKTLTDSESSVKRQGLLALDLFDRIVITADLNQAKTVDLACNLWNLAKRTGLVQDKMNVSRRNLERRLEKNNLPGVQNLLQKL